MRFKLGDRVRVIGGFRGAVIGPGEPQIGQEAVVTGRMRDDVVTRFGSWDYSRFELIDDCHTDDDLADALYLAKLMVRESYGDYVWSEAGGRGVYLPDWLRDCVADELRRRA